MLDFLKTGFQKVKSALAKSRSQLREKIQALFSGPLDEKTFEQLEEILYEADLGSELAAEFIQKTKKFLRQNPAATHEEILHMLRDFALKLLQEPPKIETQQGSPHVILVVGVNGSGKTSSIAKLAHRLQKENESVLLAAGDTFRAAAVEQLGIWAERLKCPIVTSQSGGDPSAVAFDALNAALARKIGTVIIDSAGRLQNRTELMRELEKMRKVCAKVIPSAPHETLLVLDSTMGQNALDQATLFHQSTPLTGIILTKLDGSAKGGVALAIYKKLGIPVRWIGVGEKIDDLLPFDNETYVNALFGV